MHVCTKSVECNAIAAFSIGPATACAARTVVSDRRRGSGQCRDSDRVPSAAPHMAGGGLEYGGGGGAAEGVDVGGPEPAVGVGEEHGAAVVCRQLLMLQ